MSMKDAMFRDAMIWNKQAEQHRYAEMERAWRAQQMKDEEPNERTNCDHDFRSGPEPVGPEGPHRPCGKCGAEYEVAG